MKEYLSELVRTAPTPLHARNSAREYLQARILATLQRAGAMIPLGFHGGGTRVGPAIRRLARALRNDFTWTRAAEQYAALMRV